MLDLIMKHYPIRPNTKIILLWLLILGLSILPNFVVLPRGHIMRKDNFLNVYFAKWSWAWTIGFLTPYMMLTSYTYSESLKRGIASVLLRVVICTGLWYFWTVIVFHTVQNKTAICYDTERNPVLDIDDRSSCKAKNFKWIGWDISGHIFILTFTSLMITSELQIQRKWNLITTQAAKYLTNNTKMLERVKSRQKSTIKIVKILYFTNCVLEILWFLSMVLTCLYYHTFMSKAFAAVFAILSWNVTYDGVFRYSKFPFYPGYGPIHEIICNNAARPKNKSC